MAKALKTVGMIAVIAGLAIVTGGAAVGLGFALGTTFAGVSAGALLVVGAAATLGGQLLTKPPDIPSSQSGRLSVSIDPRAPRKTVLGSTAMATDLRYQEWAGDKQDYCLWISRSRAMRSRASTRSGSTTSRCGPRPPA